MSYDLSLKLEQNFGLHQQQKLLMTLAMKQGLAVMQLPILELCEWLKTEIENNPVLEMDYPHEEPSYRKRAEGNKMSEIIEYVVAAPISLSEHLLAQARCHFKDIKDYALAEWIVGHFDERGFLTTPLEELGEEERVRGILNVIQGFDPAGIGAKDIRESLLIQLRHRQQKNDRAIRIVEDHFEDLLYNRVPLIARGLELPVEEIHQIIQREIVPLDLHPGYRFQPHHTPMITPDLLVYMVDDVWKIEINQSYLPSFHLNSAYQAALEHKTMNAEDRSFLRKHVTSGKWLKHIVNKRHHTLMRIGKFLLAKQAAFFDGGSLVPLSMSEAASALQLHESTIARAVANKYIACPQGMFALRDFFSHSLRGEEGQHVSHHMLRQKLRELIDREDKEKPYSDEAITHKMRKLGVPCARRTVSKYRRLLHIAPASKRKRWISCT